MYRKLSLMSCAFILAACQQQPLQPQASIQTPTTPQGIPTPEGVVVIPYQLEEIKRQQH